LVRLTYNFSGIRIWGSSENGHEINQEIPKKIDFESMNENLRKFVFFFSSSEFKLN